MNDHAGHDDVVDVLTGLGRHWGWLLAFGAVTLLAGLLALVWPVRTVAAVAVLLGLQLVWAGVFRFVFAFADETADGVGRVLSAMLGVLCFAVGIYALRHVLITVATTALVLGTFWIVHGALELFAAVSRPSVARRGWAVLAGVLGMLAGLVVLAYPGISLAALAIVLGGWLVVYGALAISAALRLRTAARTATSLAAAT